MRPSLSLFAAVSLALVFSFPAHGQDSPSLGDLARQAQKDKDKEKANKASAKVFTNDDMPSSSGGAAAAIGGSLGQAATSGANLSPAEKLAQMEKLLDVLDSLDKATLVRTTLSDKSDVNFPGRAAWEQRLFAAKEAYVVQARAVIQKARQIIDSAESLKGTQDPNDPRVKEVAAKLQSLTREAVQADAGMQAVIIEGRDLAAQVSAH